MSGTATPGLWNPRSASLARNWWALAIRGGIAVLFGIVAFVHPFATITSLVLIFGIYMLVDGVFAIVAGARAAAHHERWGLLILEGVVDILAGLFALYFPGGALLAAIILLSVWSVVTGALMLAAALRLHGAHGGWLFALGGIVSIVWGVLLYVEPVAGALVLTLWLGAYAFVFGIVLLVVAFRLRSRYRAYGAPHTGAAPA